MKSSILLGKSKGDVKNILRGMLPNSKMQSIKSISVIRSQLGSGSYEYLLEWLSGYPQTKYNIFASQRKKIKNDFQVQPLLERVGLENEFLWCAIYLKINSNRVLKILEYRDKIESSIKSGSWVRANQILEEFEEVHGASLWGMELKAVIIQKMYGYDAQKKYVDGLVKQGPGSIAAYCASRVSYRNTERLSPGLYFRKTKENIEKQNIASEYKSYLKYRLLRVFPGKEEEFEDILRVESFTSIIDLVDTFCFLIRYVAYINLNLTDLIYRKVERYVKYLPEEILYKGKYVECPMPLKKSVLYKDGNLIKLIKENNYTDCLEYVDEHGVDDPSLLLYLAKCISIENLDLGFDSDNVQIEILQCLVDIYRLSESAQFSIGRIEKIGNNYSGFDFGRFLKSLKLDPGNILLLTSESTFFCTAKIGIIDPEYAPVHVSKYLRADLDAAYNVMFSSWYDFRPGLSESLPLNDNIYRANNCLRFSANQSLSGIIGAIDSDGLEPKHNEIERLRIISQIANSEIEESIESVVSSVCHNESIKNVLPIQNIIDQRDSKQWVDRAGNISTSILLGIYFSLDNSRLVEDLLRDVWDEFVLAHSLLPFSESKYGSWMRENRSRCIFFLRNVCVPSVMDISPYFQNEKEILEERISICSFLAEFDLDNIDSYQEEVRDLTTYLQTSKGLEDLDKSRIYVDAGAIKQNIRKDVEPSFEVYKTLTQGQRHLPEDYEKVILDAISEGKTPPDDYLQLPQSDAILELVELVRGLKNEFLSNQEFGLDTYVSMRIRHGTLKGTLISAFHENGMAIQKTSDGYNVHDKLAICLEGMPKEARMNVLDLIEDFMKRFDATVTEIRDEEIQIKSKNKNKGLIDIELNTLMINSIISYVDDSVGFDDFFEYCFEMFWQFIPRSLVRIREVFEVRLKSHVAKELDKIKDSVIELCGGLQANQEAFEDFFKRVGTHFQYQCDRIAGWFNPPELEALRRAYSLDLLVTIATQSVINLYPSFTPKINRIIDEDFSLDKLSLQHVTDVLFIMIDNAFKHSGKVDPRIDIEINVEDKHIIMKVINELAVEASEQMGEELKSQIDVAIKKKDASKINKEGKSGIFKLSKYASKDKPGALDMRFNGLQFEARIMLNYHKLVA